MASDGWAPTFNDVRRCKTVSADGTVHCLGPAIAGSDYCRHHDPAFERDANDRIIGLKSAPKVAEKAVELPSVRRAIGIGGLPKLDAVARVAKPQQSRASEIAKAETLRAYDDGKKITTESIHGKLFEERPLSAFERYRSYRSRSTDGRIVVTTVRYNVVTRREVVMDREVMHEHFAHSRWDAEDGK